MNKHSTAVAALLVPLLLAAGALRAADYQAGTLTVAQPWSRPTPVASVGVVYLLIANQGSAADRLVGLNSPVAEHAQIHESRRVGGMLEMRQLAQLECPPHGTVKFEPGGLHIMLVGLAHPLASGSDFPLTLRFEKAGELTVQVRVAERD
jgi:copper(I)-binding protein